MKIVRTKDLPLLAASHEPPEAPGALKRVLFTKPDLLEGRVQMVNWSYLPRGRSFRAHYHEDMEEVFIILRGRARIALDGEEAELAEGDAVVVPARAVHRMESLGGEDVEYLALGISQGRGGRTVLADP